MHIEKKTLRNIFIGVVSCIVLYWILHETERVNSVFSVISGIVAPFILGSVLAFIINVPMRAIERRLVKINKPVLKRLISLIVTLLLVTLVLSLVFYLLIPQVVATIQSLIPKLKAFFLGLEDVITDFLADNPEIMSWIVANTDFENLKWAELAEKVFGVVGNSVSTIITSTFAAIGSITSALMDAFIAIVFSIYCLFQKETLARQGRKILYAFFPEKFSDGTVRILQITNSTFSNFLSGQCIEVCILGSMFAIAMAIFRMPYIPLVSVLIAVTAFIPIVGAWIGCVCGAFLILVNDPVQAIIFVVMFLVIQQIENNMIYPRVVGTSIGLSGMWVLVAVAVGGELFGVAGMFLMIPVAAVLQTLLREHTAKKLSDKDVPSEKLVIKEPEIPVKKVKENKKKKNKKTEK